MPDFMHMEQGTTTNFLGQLEAKVGTFGRAWQSNASAITDNEPGIGAGRLGAAFRSVYEEYAIPTHAAAARIQPAYEEMCGLARRGVSEYGSVDQAIANLLKGLTDDARRA